MVLPACASFCAKRLLQSLHTLWPQGKRDTVVLSAGSKQTGHTVANRSRSLCTTSCLRKLVPVWSCNASRSLHNSCLCLEKLSLFSTLSRESGSSLSGAASDGSLKLWGLVKQHLVWCTRSGSRCFWFWVLLVLGTLVV